MSCKNPTDFAAAALSQRAVLLPQHIGRAFQLSRYPVSDILAPWAEFHWIVEWDLPEGAQHRQQVMPYPNPSLAFEVGRSAIHGPAHAMFTRELTGRGRVHGVRFRCGGLRPWLDGPLSALRDGTFPAACCLPPGTDLAGIERQVLYPASHDEAISRVEALLAACRPADDPWIARLDAAVAAVQADRAIAGTAPLRQLLGVSERGLQRLFASYLGVTPKWLIQRARIHDALQLLVADRHTPLAHLGAQLGFFDQAHFTRCFRQHTGRSPQQYRHALRQSDENICADGMDRG